MTDDAKKARNEYFKKYRQANRERIKEINNRYWDKRAKAETTTDEPRKQEAKYN